MKLDFTQPIMQLVITWSLATESLCVSKLTCS